MILVLGKYAKDGSWSPNERSLFKNLFAEQGGTYLDIGANIGLTVIAVSQNTNVRCYAFEPEPNNFRYLAENVSVNCCVGNVHLLNVALFDKNAVVPFEIAVRHSGDHRISMSSGRGQLGEHTRRKVAVQARRLDDLVINGTEPLAAKIDVQGAEPFVIAGGRNVLSRASLLSLEFWPYSMHRMGGDINAAIGFLVEHFQEGTVSPGDKDREAIWQPIVTIAALLQSFAKERRGKYDYLDVMVRKANTRLTVKVKRCLSGVKVRNTEWNSRCGRQHGGTVAVS